ncbi:hypothetical protein G9A89_010955 [Geosiphon pyriformis]|nr:hypothetical protein G9A89_010955 [Geosiphon pyriformis]
MRPQFKGLPFSPKATERGDHELLEDVKLLFPQLKQVIRRRMNDIGSSINEIMFVGHGFGGRYASIAGFQWALERFVIMQKKLWPEIDLMKTHQEVITFGAPRVGNKEFSLSLNKAIDHYRFTHGNDHVPHFPSALMGWKHFGSEIWIEPLNGCDCSEDDQGTYWDCNHIELSTGKQRPIWMGIYSNENLVNMKLYDYDNFPSTINLKFYPFLF